MYILYIYIYILKIIHYLLIYECYDRYDLRILEENIRQLH